MEFIMMKTITRIHKNLIRLVFLLKIKAQEIRMHICPSVWVQGIVLVRNIVGTYEIDIVLQLPINFQLFFR